VEKREENGLRYLVMEFVPGNNVAQLLDHGPIEEHRAAGIAIQVARALDHAHRSEIVHRDIKPANILVTAEGVAKLGDLGLAKNIDGDASQTEEGMAMGTPFYVSPEQARGERRVDIRSDIYSLGATLFHLLSGRPVFDSKSAITVLMDIRTKPAPDITTVEPAVPASVARVLQKCLAKKPEDRYQTPDELAVDLRTAGKGL
jgi:serine/threonine-protein kinase